MSTSAARYAFAVIGVVLLLCSFLVVDHTASFARHAARTQGTVTALVRHQSTSYSGTKASESMGATYSTSYSYVPVVRFQHGAQQIQFTDSVGTNPPAFRVGETVTVLYLESNPYDARIESFSSLWCVPLIIGGMGGIFLAFGVRVIFASRPAVTN